MIEHIHTRQPLIASSSGRAHVSPRSCVDFHVYPKVRLARASAAVEASLIRQLNALGLFGTCAIDTARSQPRARERRVPTERRSGLCRASRGPAPQSCHRPAPLLLASLAALELANTALPGACKAGEALPVEFLSKFLDDVERLGVYGPIVFVATVIGAEMVPLFPTQPLSIASGLLFGSLKGSLLALLGTSTAAILAFQLSRRVGRRLAERVIAEEITEEDRKRGMLAKVKDAVDSGSFSQQLIAVTLLRLTPVVPFSASNYLLGATPLKFGAYLGGSLLGLSFWCVLFASLGGASRGVLRTGLGLEELYADIADKASVYAEDAAVAVCVLGALSLLAFKLWPGDEHADGNGEEHEKI